MLAVKEQFPLRFYEEDEYNHAKKLVFDLYIEQEFHSGWSLDITTGWDIPVMDDLFISLGYTYTQEVILKQADTGKFISFFSQEDAKEALKCDEKYEELFGDVLDFFSYNGGFSQQSFEVENSFLHDVKYLLESHQLFRIQSAEDADTENGIRVVVEGNELIAIDSPLQEVW